MVSEADEKTQEQILRRRSADKEIEDEAPDHRRKSDKSLQEAPIDDELPFRLPYLTDEIIPATSRFRVYRRTLLNSEAYAAKELFPTAISLYEGVSSRINDVVTKNKIEANIRFLKGYSRNREEARHKGDKSFGESAPGSEMKQTFEQIKNEIKNKLRDDIEKLTEFREFTEGPKIQSELQELKNSLNNLAEDKNRLNRELDYLKTKKIDDEDDKSEILNLKGEINRIKGLEERNRKELDEMSQLRDEITRFKATQERNENDKSEIMRLHEEIKRLKGIEDQNLQTRIEILKLNEEINKIKSSGEPEDKDRDRDKGRNNDRAHNEKVAEEINSLKEKMETLSYQKVLQYAEENKIDEIKNHLHKLDSRLNDMATGTISKAERQPERETRPVEDLLNEISDKFTEALKTRNENIKSFAEPVESRGKSIEDDEADIFEKIIKSGTGEDSRGDKSTEKIIEPPVEKIEETTTIQKEKKEEDKNEFDLISDYTRDIDAGGMSDEEIFDKILKDDKNKKPDDESFEILGFKKKEDGDYEVMSRDEDNKKKDEENFYRNFLKTNKRMKKELPILKVNYDFTKLPDHFSLSKEKNILEYSFYKYKPMLEKAGELIKKRKVREAIDYYRVVMSQNIPIEFKSMIKKNIHDLTEYLEKYLTAD